MREIMNILRYAGMNVVFSLVSYRTNVCLCVCLYEMELSCMRYGLYLLGFIMFDSLRCTAIKMR